MSTSSRLLLWGGLLVLSATAGLGCRSAPRPAAALLYVDLDGTLLDDHSRVAPVNAQALARFQAAGGRVGVATGRIPERGIRFARAIAADLPSIFANGAVILSPSGQALAVRGITDPDDVAAMCDRITRAGCKQFYAAHGHAATGQVKVEMGTCAPDPTPGFGAIKLRAKVCRDHDTLLAELPALTGGRYEIIEGGTGDHRGVSISAKGATKGATKGAAVAFVAARLGVPLSQVAYVGDSGNDVSAAKAVVAGGGRCFAVANAVQALKAVCPEHLPVSNAEGAVARVVQILLSSE